jgi:hypothetical protein
LEKETMSDPTDAPGTKRPYVTPEVRKVNLRPEEAVLGNCKTGGATGPGTPNCTTGGSCFSIGS